MWNKKKSSTQRLWNQFTPNWLILNKFKIFFQVEILLWCARLLFPLVFETSKKCTPVPSRRSIRGGTFLSFCPSMYHPSLHCHNACKRSTPNAIPFFSAPASDASHPWLRFASIPAALSLWLCTSCLTIVSWNVGGVSGNAFLLWRINGSVIPTRR